MQKDEKGLKATVTISESNVNDEQVQIVDPIKDLDLGDTAYKVEKADMSDTAPKLKQLGLSYFTVRGGEVVKKEFNGERTAVVFNKDASDEFEIPILGAAGRRRSYSELDTWYANKAFATGLAKELTAAEIDKAKETQEEWSGAINFLNNQLEQNQY